MSIALLKQLIAEHIDDMMNQSIIRKDDEGDLIIRKLVKFKKPTTRFSSEDNVDAELDSYGNVIVDDLETWKPDYDDIIKNG